MQAMHSHVSHHLSCMTSSKQEAAPATAAGWLVEANQSSARKPTFQAIVDNIVGSQSKRHKITRWNWKFFTGPVLTRDQPFPSRLRRPCQGVVGKAKKKKNSGSFSLHPCMPSVYLPFQLQENCHAQSCRPAE
jgi:hypothetical protein